jgi:hypothetical protein
MVGAVVAAPLPVLSRGLCLLVLQTLMSVLFRICVKSVSIDALSARTACFCFLCSLSNAVTLAYFSRGIQFDFHRSWHKGLWGRRKARNNSVEGAFIVMLPVSQKVNVLLCEDCGGSQLGEAAIGIPICKAVR